MLIIEFSLGVAYLDPGAGSLLMQALVGGAAGLLLAFRHLWKTIRYSRQSDSTGPR
ncbi:MAG: hypothetical protein ACKPHU_29255 [Planctomycetaceae bacterium]|jgi:hypothetical protein